MKIPNNHPRKKSLEERKRIEEGFAKGIVVAAGMIAHGRGEALDYLIGERTHPEAKREIMAAAAQLLLAKNPVISVNGNTTALCAREIVSLAKAIPAKIEVNLFYRTPKRIALIEKEFRKFGVRILAGGADKKIPLLKSKRGMVHGAGIYSADVVLVMLEDGDRTEFLGRMGKIVVAVDLNPLSRTALKANITIVDNVTRALPLLTKSVKSLRGMKSSELERTAKFNNKKSLREMEMIMREGV